MSYKEKIIDTMVTPDQKLGIVRYQGGNITSILLSFSRIGETVFMHSITSALHHGDEAMEKVAELITEKSRELKHPIIHQDTPWNKPSEAMFRRHGYKLVGIERRTKYKVYEKIYD